MKGIRQTITIQKRGGASEVVSALVYGNLALHPVPSKVPKNGRLVTAYVITHVPTGLRTTNLLRGQDFAKKAVEELVQADDWGFQDIYALEPERRRKLLEALYRVDERERGEP